MSGRLQQWLRLAPGRLADCLANALLGLTVLLIVGGVLVLLSGQAGSLNNALASSAGIFGSPVYHPDNDPAVMVGIMNNFYPGVLTFARIMLVLAGAVIVVAVLSVLAWLGRKVVKLVASITGSPSVGLIYLTTFIMWSLVIVVLWLLLNVDNTLYYLLAACAGLLINLLLMWLAGKMNILVAGRAVAETSEAEPKPKSDKPKDRNEP